MMNWKGFGRNRACNFLGGAEENYKKYQIRRWTGQD
jgi:hypothetical protein